QKTHKLGRIALGLCCFLMLKNYSKGWGFSSVVERLPSKRKALGSVPSSKKKKKDKRKKKLILLKSLQV
ncbi:hypothetical protein OFB83_32000, partial [Escherichia coli]|nr:hypothetical protein [Escherichia coli]